jgi:hypothetical protein
VSLYLFILFAVALFCLAVGIFVGARLGRDAYNGVMIVEETQDGLRYRLELAGDPELLAFQDSVIFKVVGPDYEELLSRQKLGV